MNKCLITTCCALLGAGSLLQAATQIELDAASPGRTFEGIGAVSAGASTRNLLDYPEKERAEVLDFLFKPKFGAGLQHLKVEVGGDDNSTCGSEPSHVISRAELKSPKARGYEFWLMAEARKRNPRIQLDCLPWCYPYWVTNRFSQDSADWLVAFLEVARKQYHLEVDWLAAAQNEMGTDLSWVSNVLRPTLARQGYANVKLQAPDDARAHWMIFEQFANQPAYGATLAAVGYHYPSHWLPQIEDDKLAVPEAVKATGKPLWSSEEFSYSGKTWEKALLWAQLINKSYIRDRITKVEAWCPVDGIYPGIPFAGTGLMQANQPWSGHYEVWPTIWTTAHTTQFAEPGWRYLDSACGKVNARTWTGSYVSLMNPKSKDWSMVLCTGTNKESLQIKVASNLKQGPVHVWKSTASAQFVPLPDVPVVNGGFELVLEKDALYSVTTTVGQRKGVYAQVPEARPFPLPYKENFESYLPGVTPKYLSDQKGSFETIRRPNGGMCLQQIALKEGILWFRKYRTPYTVWGDDTWKDYRVKADVLVRDGSVELGGRFSRTDSLDTSVVLHHDGAWELVTHVDVQTEKGGKKTKRAEARILASGTLPNFPPESWHKLEIAFRGTTATASIDGQFVGAGEAKGRNQGMPYLASSFDPNCFDNLEVTAETATANL